MTNDIKARILDNHFIDLLRTELKIDNEQFNDLCIALVELAEAWREVPLIDKELMQDLYVQASVTSNMAETFESISPEQAHTLREMATQIDALVLNCLAK